MNNLRKNTIFAIIYRSTAFIISLLGILSARGILTGNIKPVGNWLYYTNQSNIVVIVMFLILIILTIKSLVKNGRIGQVSFLPKFCYYTLMCINLTFVVYWVLIAGYMPLEQNLTFWNLSVHCITPILFTIDYILFTDKTPLNKFDPLFACIAPAVYFVVNIILGFCGVIYPDGAHFPYYFMDFHILGYMMILYSVGVLIFYLGLSYFVLYLSKLQKKTKTNK